MADITAVKNDSQRTVKNIVELAEELDSIIDMIELLIEIGEAGGLFSPQRYYALNEAIEATFGSHIAVSEFFNIPTGSTRAVHFVELFAETDTVVTLQGEGQTFFHSGEGTYTLFAGESFCFFYRGGNSWGIK